MLLGGAFTGAMLTSAAPPIGVMLPNGEQGMLGRRPGHI
jgi:hypothetical protein